MDSSGSVAGLVDVIFAGEFDDGDSAGRSGEGFSSRAQ